MNNDTREVRDEQLIATKVLQMDPPVGPLDWMGATWSRTLLSWGAVGVVCSLLMWVMYTGRSDMREDLATSREVHKEAFERLRQDNVELREYDREMRTKSNALTSEGNATLKEIHIGQATTQAVMIEALKENKKLVLQIEEVVKEMRKIKERIN